MVSFVSQSIGVRQIHTNGSSKMTQNVWKYVRIMTNFAVERVNNKLSKKPKNNPL